MYFFPTCQVRVVRFYVGCPLPSSPCPRPTSLCRHLRHLLRQLYVAKCRSQWAAPGFNRQLQIAVGSAGPQQGAPEPASSRAE